MSGLASQPRELERIHDYVDYGRPRKGPRVESYCVRLLSTYCVGP